MQKTGNYWCRGWAECNLGITDHSPVKCL